MRIGADERGKKRLLSTVFLLGCQDLGSEPVGPGPEFNKPFSILQIDCPVALDKGHCHVDDVDLEPTFKVKVTDDVFSDPAEQIMTGSSFFK